MKQQYITHPPLVDHRLGLANVKPVMMMNSNTKALRTVNTLLKFTEILAPNPMMVKATMVMPVATRSGYSDTHSLSLDSRPESSKFKLIGPTLYNRKNRRQN